MLTSTTVVWSYYRAALPARYLLLSTVVTPFDKNIWHHACIYIARIRLQREVRSVLPINRLNCVYNHLRTRCQFLFGVASTSEQGLQFDQSFLPIKHNNLFLSLSLMQRIMVTVSNTGEGIAYLQNCGRAL